MGGRSWKEGLTRLTCVRIAWNLLELIDLWFLCEVGHDG